MTYRPAIFLCVILSTTTFSFAKPLQTVSWSQKGISLGLFAEDPGFDYQPLIDEIVATGATHISLIVPYYQYDFRSVTISSHSRFTPDDAVIQQTLKQAKRSGLSVTLFPILRLEYQATPDEWRGNLRPKDPAAWWQSYGALMQQLARWAAQNKTDALCIGSELSWADVDPAPWKKLINDIRKIYRGKLIYSANHDHFDQVAIWNLVDEAGISGYFELVGLDEKSPTTPRMMHGWREVRSKIARWWARTKRPMFFSEIGYHSMSGTAAQPWLEAMNRPLDLSEQHRAYKAFFQFWSTAPYVKGVYIWNWYGYGGLKSREYAVRGKPASQVLCHAFGAKDCPTTWGIPRRNDQTPY